MEIMPFAKLDETTHLLAVDHQARKAFLAGLSMCIPCKYALSGARTALGYRRGTAGAPSSASWGDVGTM